MTRCPSCGKEIPDGSTSCPSCEAAVEDLFADTRLFENVPTARSRPPDHQQTPRRSSATTSFESIDDARFVPGTIFAGRYRIVGLLGRGGMGEVYRADDLTLSQPVALKFLPSHLLHDGAALARFHREVRVARQVSHPNVCRVYDIGEVDGHHYLSMEFIKGEELSSLLRRIGRLPSDKATEIARQLCAGLAAAHNRGVLHRDLKPANVMIDENGNVRLTDFGIAGLLEEIGSEEIRAGTPAYMSPEQLKGAELSVKSDIYSLGLVLYEVFTGKKAFEAPTLGQLIDLRNSDTTPAIPSALIRDIDPLVERVILLCLEKDAGKRPDSALQVAASLPGGDPLAAALAAGETPSPEMVAAARKEGILQSRVAVACLASVLLGIALVVLLSGRTKMHRRIPLEKSPEVLKERAQEIAKKLGYTARPLDTESGLNFDPRYLEYVRHRDQSLTRWDNLTKGRPGVLFFWYRQSPRYLEAYNRMIVTGSDPPRTVSGMVSSVLDTQGRLIYFDGVPPQLDPEEAGADTQTSGAVKTTSLIQRDTAAKPVVPNAATQAESNVPPSPRLPVSASASAPPSAPDWSALFTEAGLDLSKFRAIASRWVPAHNSDFRAAWEGVLPEAPEIPIRVEAASYQGKPIYFEIVFPWDKPTRQEESEEEIKFKLINGLLITLLIVIMVTGVLLARRNLRLGRGDQKGASRLALFVFGLNMLTWVLGAHHVPKAGSEFDIFLQYLAYALFFTALLWVVYIALEPFVRRRWPNRIISWTRLLGGDFRDPLVGRDVLIGLLAGIGLTLTYYLWSLAPKWLGWPVDAPSDIEYDSLLGLRALLNQSLDGVLLALLQALGYLFLLLLLSHLLRRDWVAVGVSWLLLAVILSVTGNTPALDWFFAGAAAAIMLGTLMRFGLLAAAFMFLVCYLSYQLPITSDFSAWYASGTLLVLFTFLAVAIYGFYTSLGGQPLFKGGLLRE